MTGRRFAGTALCIALALASVAGGPAVVAQVQAPNPALEQRQIELSFQSETHSCENCPEFVVTFRDGSVEAKCLGGCAIPGTHREPFSNQEFVPLMQAFYSARFFEIPREVGGCIDCSTITLGYRDGQRVHEVQDVGFSKRPELEALQKRLRDAARPVERYLRPLADNYRQLLDEGLDPNEPLGPRGMTALDYAVNGPADAVSLLLSRGARVTQRALDAAAYCSPDVLAVLWSAAGVQPSSARARRALFTAIDGCTVVVEFVLSKGVDVNVRDPESGITPLLAAARHGREETARLLLQRGANRDVRDNAGHGLLWFAVEAGSRLLEELVRQAPVVDDPDADGKTLLMHAAQSCSAQGVRLLLERGASRSRTETRGRRAEDLIPMGFGSYRVSGCTPTRETFDRMAGAIPAPPTPNQSVLTSGLRRDVAHVELTIESTNSTCLGCPAYRVRLQSNALEFSCLSDYYCVVPRYFGPFPRAEFEALVQAFDDAKFFEVPRLLPTGCHDCGETTVTYRDERRIHQVRALGPANIQAIDDLIARLWAAAMVVEPYFYATPENYTKLLDAGLDPNELVSAREVPLDFAFGNYENVRVLLSRGARVDARLLRLAARGDSKFLDMFWNAAPPAATSGVAQSMLVEAASINNTDNVTWLLAKGISVNARDSLSGRTALMSAAESCAPANIRLLLANGADARRTDESGKTALELVPPPTRKMAAACDEARRALGGSR